MAVPKLYSVYKVCISFLRFLSPFPCFASLYIKCHMLVSPLGVNLERHMAHRARDSAPGLLLTEKDPKSCQSGACLEKQIEVSMQSGRNELALTRRLHWKGTGRQKLHKERMSLSLSSLLFHQPGYFTLSLLPCRFCSIKISTYI